MLNLSFNCSIILYHNQVRKSRVYSKYFHIQESCQRVNFWGLTEKNSGLWCPFLKFHPGRIQRGYFLLRIFDMLFLQGLRKGTALNHFRFLLKKWVVVGQSTLGDTSFFYRLCLGLNGGISHYPLQ